MDLWRSLNGMINIELTGADLASSLSTIQEKGISVYKIKRVDDLSVRFLLRRQDFGFVQKLVERKGDRIHIIKNSGLFWLFRGLIQRPVLVAGLLLVLIASCYLPTRIWFLKVEGNVSIPTQYILEKASRCGISFGADRQKVRSEKMKNFLLEAIPQLQWAGINTKGCVAVISVKEREITGTEEDKNGVSSIVASQDGVILSCTATKGNLLCRIGQAVEAGQTLISGYTDCGLSIRATRAEGEVYARTERNFSAIAPMQCIQKGEVLRRIKKYSLIIGKKQINFDKDSGILDASCDKMYSEKILTLPGGFQLPIVLVTEVWVFRDNMKTVMEENQMSELLSQYADTYLRQQMVSGEILLTEEAVIYNEGFAFLEGQYACREMIGRVQIEEIVAPNGKYD